MTAGPNGQKFTIQVHNGLHPDDDDALIEYKCYVCGEAGTSYGMPSHFRASKTPDLDLKPIVATLDVYPNIIDPESRWECAARDIETRSRFRFEVEPRRELMP